MNREIASAPEKSEADFCARRTAAVSRQRRQTVNTPPDCPLKRVYGAERGKREKTARQLGARALKYASLITSPATIRQRPSGLTIDPRSNIFITRAN